MRYNQHLTDLVADVTSASEEHLETVKALTRAWSNLAQHLLPEALSDDARSACEEFADTLQAVLDEADNMMHQTLELPTEEDI